jgi:FKBP-type peptidyl-prolyl cis-trans isomerase (trigger factor)
MLVEIKKIDPVRRELKFEIGKDRVSKRLEEVYKEIGKVAKVKGFRPGKAPKHLIESQHGQVAQEEVLKSLIPEVYREAIEKEDLKPIDMPEIEDVHFKDGIITFKAQLDIKPDVKVSDYKGIRIQRKSNDVSDEEINKTLDYFRKGKGDKEVEINDDFAKSIGYPTLEEFKSSLKRQMEMDKDRHNRQDIENQIVEVLLKNSKLTTPQSLVKRQTEQRMYETLERLKKQGMNEEEIKKREDEIRKSLVEAVEKDIRVYFILDKIAEDEKIEIKEGENIPTKVLAFLLKEAQWDEEKEPKKTEAKKK